MYNKSQLNKDRKDAKKPRALAKPKDIDYVSKMGYRDDSPFNNRSYIDINTPNGSIDMSNTGIDLIANGRFLPAYSGLHQFDTTTVREIPAAENGGEYMDLTEDEIAEYRRGGYVVEELPKAQNGITYVNDLNDPRLLEYQERLRLHQLGMQKKQEYYALLKKINVNPDYKGFRQFGYLEPQGGQERKNYWNDLYNWNAQYHPDYVEHYSGADLGSYSDMGINYDSSDKPYLLYKPKGSKDLKRLYGEELRILTHSGYPMWKKPENEVIYKKLEEEEKKNPPVVEAPPVEIPEEEIKLPIRPIDEVVLPEQTAPQKPEMVTIKQRREGEKNIFGRIKNPTEDYWEEIQVPLNDPAVARWQERLEYARKNNPNTPLLNFTEEAINPIRRDGGAALPQAQRGGDAYMLQQMTSHDKPHPLNDGTGMWYFPTRSIAMHPNDATTLTDWLMMNNKPFDKSSRSDLYTSLTGLTDYSGSVSQNVELLKMLKSGTKPTPQTTTGPPTTTSTATSTGPTPPAQGDPDYDRKLKAYNRYLVNVESIGPELALKTYKASACFADYCPPAAESTTTPPTTTSGFVNGPAPDQNTDPTLEYVGTNQVVKAVNENDPYGATTTTTEHLYKKKEELPAEEIKLEPKEITEQNLKDAFTPTEPEMVWVRQYQHPEKNMFGKPKKGQEGSWLEKQVPAGSDEANRWYGSSQHSPDSIAYFHKYPMYDAAGNKVYSNTNQSKYAEIPKYRQFDTEGAFPYGYGPSTTTPEELSIDVETGVRRDGGYVSKQMVHFLTGGSYEEPLPKAQFGMFNSWKKKNVDQVIEDAEPVKGVQNIPEVQASGSEAQKKLHISLIDKANALARTIEGRRVWAENGPKDWTLSELQKYINNVKEFNTQAQKYERDRRLVMDGKLDTGVFAQRYREGNWARFDENTGRENYRGEYKNAVDEGMKRKQDNYEFVKEFGKELSGYNSAKRIANDPLGTLEGVVQTGADAFMLPVAVNEGLYNYFTKDNFDMGTNPLTGLPYGEGFNETMDVAAVLPFASGARSVVTPFARTLAKGFGAETRLANSVLASDVLGTTSQEIRLLPNAQRSEQLGMQTFDIVKGEQVVGEVAGNTTAKGNFQVMDIGVEPQFQKQGIGKEVYKQLNQNLPEGKNVESWGAFVESNGVKPGEKTWQALEREGLAVKNEQGVYQMVPNKSTSPKVDFAQTQANINTKLNEIDAQIRTAFTEGDMAKVDDLAKQKEVLTAQSDANISSQYGTTSAEASPSFTSEIDWGKWNSEIPNNQQLMTEYTAIEQNTKANGTWMKNADGTAYKGTPEQFVQEQSINYKNAYPQGNQVTYRGYSEDVTPRLAEAYPEGRSIFGGDKATGMHYAPNNNKAIVVSPQAEQSGVFELMYPNDSRGLTFDAQGAGWRDVSVDPELGIQNTFNGQPSTFRSSTHGGAGQSVSTDDIAAYIENNDIPYATVNNVFDGTQASAVNIVNNKAGRFLKSRWGNNGMFDLSNPNIYKSVVPAVGGAGAAGYLMNQEVGDQSAEGLKEGGSASKPANRWAVTDPRSMQVDDYFPKLAEGGSSSQLYIHPDRMDAVYKKDSKGKWLIKSNDTSGKFVPLKDPNGKRAANLNKYAVPAKATKAQAVSGERSVPLHTVHGPLNKTLNPLGYRPSDTYTYSNPWRDVPDDLYEDLGEIIDPTGGSSWDDVARSYKREGMSPETAWEAFGAIPFLGKARWLGETAQNLGKALAVTGRQQRSAKNFGNVMRVVGNYGPGAGRATDAYQAYVNHFTSNNAGPKYQDGGNMDPGNNALELHMFYDKDVYKQDGGEIGYLTDQEIEALRKQGFRVDVE